jgi:hypothetical protein
MPPSVQEQRSSPYWTLHLYAEAQDVVIASPPQHAVEDRLRPPATRFMQDRGYGFPRRPPLKLFGKSLKGFLTEST